MNVFEKLQEIMANTLEIPASAITQETTMDEIEEWDSLGHVHIMVALEQAFDLYMDVDDFADKLGRCRNESHREPLLCSTQATTSRVLS